MVEHRGGHTAYLNSAAFQKAGVTEATPDPPGGHFDRDPATGRLSGRAAETAQQAIESKIPSTLSRGERREGVKLISEMMSRTGITSATDAGGSPDDLRAYQDAREAGELSLRVYCHLRVAHLDHMIAAGVRTGLGVDWVRVGAVKMVCDGSISERTARLSQPYVGRPDDRGILVTPEAELYAQAAKAHDAGWRLGVHCNGT